MTEVSSVRGEVILPSNVVSFSVSVVAMFPRSPITELIWLRVEPSSLMSAVMLVEMVETSERSQESVRLAAEATRLSSLVT